MVYGSDASVKSQVSDVKKFPGITKVYSATSDDLENPYGGAFSIVAKNLIEKNGYDKVVALSSSFGKDVIPRIGGLMDLQAITDIIEIKDGGSKFVRPIYAGNALCTVSSIDKIKLMTIRGTNFDKVAQGEEGSYETEEVSLDGLAEQ